MTRILTHEEIDRLAEDLRHRFDEVSETGWVRVEKMVERMGGEIHVMFETVDRPESLQVRAVDDFTIIVPWNTSVTRDRFTIAHELGHLQLHYKDDGSNKAFYRYGTDRPEIEANAFASALLMPREHFEQAWAELNGDRRRLAERFGVSKSSIGARAEVLELR